MKKLRGCFNGMHRENHPCIAFRFFAYFLSTWYLTIFSVAAGNGVVPKDWFCYDDKAGQLHLNKPVWSTVITFLLPQLINRWRIRKNQCVINHFYRAKPMLSATVGQANFRHLQSPLLVEASKYFCSKAHKKDILAGIVHSVADNGKWNIVLQDVDTKFRSIEITAQAQINISDPALFKHFEGMVTQFIPQKIDFIGEKQLHLLLLPVHSILECAKRHVIYQKFLLQDTEKANLLDWTKRYTAKILFFNDKFAFVEVAATNLIGVIAMKELPFYISEGSSVLARVLRLSPLKLDFPKYFDIKRALSHREYNRGSPKSIILTTGTSVQLVKSLVQQRESVEKQPIHGLLTEARYQRERKNDLFEDELLSILGSKYYTKLQQERKKHFYGINEGLDKELAHHQSDYPVDLAGWFLNDDHRHTIDDINAYVSCLSRDREILKTLDLEKILCKMIMAKQQLAVLPTTSNGKLERLRKALSGEPLISKETIENYPGLNIQTKQVLLKILVNRTDPIKALQKLITEQKSKLPKKVNALIAKYKHAEIVEPPNLPPDNMQPRERRDGRSLQNSTLLYDNTSTPMNLDHLSYARIKKYDTVLRMALQNRTKATIRHDEELMLLNQHEGVQLSESLQYQGNTDNLLHIPVPE